MEDDGLPVDFDADDGRFDAQEVEVGGGDALGVGGEEGVDESGALGGVGVLRNVAVGEAGGDAGIGSRLDEDQREAIKGLAVPGALGDLPGGDILVGAERGGGRGGGRFECGIRAFQERWKWAAGRRWLMRRGRWRGGGRGQNRGAARRGGKAAWS